MDRESSVRFGQYLQSVIKIKELEKMTDELNEELINSQRIMTEIKTIFETAPTNLIQIESNVGAQNDEPVYAGLERNEPNQLMDGMEEISGQGNLESIIAEMKTYAEDIKKKVSETKPEHNKPHINIESLNSECVTGFNQLRKRLDTIKINQVVNKQNENLETIITQLCQDVDMFIQRMHLKTTISQSSGNQSVSSKEVDVFQFISHVNKLLSGFNEVIYTLQNKN